MGEEPGLLICRRKPAGQVCSGDATCSPLHASCCAISSFAAAGIGYLSAINERDAGGELSSTTQRDADGGLPSGEAGCSCLPPSIGHRVSKTLRDARFPSASIALGQTVSMGRYGVLQSPQSSPICIESSGRRSLISTVMKLGDARGIQINREMACCSTRCCFAAFITRAAHQTLTRASSGRTWNYATSLFLPPIAN